MNPDAPSLCRPDRKRRNSKFKIEKTFFQNRRLRIQLPLNQPLDLAGVGETADPVFRKDHVAVDLDVEDTSAALDQVHISSELVFQISRQTGGSWEVVSFHAVLDRYVHDTLQASSTLAKDTPFSPKLRSEVSNQMFEA